MSGSPPPNTNIASNLTLKSFNHDEAQVNPSITLPAYDSTTTSDLAAATLQATNQKELTIGVADTVKLTGTADATGSTASETHTLYLGPTVQLSNVDTVTGESPTYTHTHTLDVNSTVRLATGKDLVFNNDNNAQTISGIISSRGQSDVPPAGVEFSGDAQFNIIYGGANTKVRISDLYDPSGNIEYIANTLSAVCRRVFASSYIATPPSDAQTPNQGGEIQDNPEAETGHKHGGDAHWIQYFACLNLDSKNPPGVVDN